MPINFLDSENEKKYSEFVSNSKDSTIYHTMEWKDVIESTFGFRPLTILSENEKGNVEGALPLFLCKTAFGKSVISSPFFIFGGLLSETEKATNQLITKAKQLTKDNNAKYLLVKQRSKLSPKLVGEHGLKNEVREHTFHLKLDKDPQTVFKKLPKGSVRWGVKKATERGVSVREGESVSDLRQFYHLFLLTRRNIGIPAYPFKMFKKIWNGFSEKGQMKVLFADYGDEPIASIIIYLYNNTINYAHAGAIPGKEIMKLQPYHLLIWKAIELGCANGFKILDMHGATPGMSGLYEFKKRWSEETIELPYYYFPNVAPYNNPEDAKFKFLRNIWKRFPLKVTEALSGSVTKHLTR
jgi:lipid II:glycine glycyltransferase (peptidoglycan interpeptide bridge formation enzyme)